MWLFQLFLVCLVTQTTLVYANLCEDGQDHLSGMPRELERLKPERVSDRVAKWFKIPLPEKRLARFSKLPLSDQETIIDLLGANRLAERGTMLEKDLIEELWAIARDPRVGQSIAEQAAKHLIAVVAKVDQTTIGAYPVHEEFTPEGYSLLNSNSSWNRGTALVALADMSARRGLSPAKQAILVNTLCSKIAPKGYEGPGKPSMPTDGFEQEMALDATANLLLPETDLPTDLRFRLHSALKLGVNELPSERLRKRASDLERLSERN